MSENFLKEASGAHQSNVGHMDFTSLPIVGLFGVARTAADGGAKYGRHNYVLGIPVHSHLNHALQHIYGFLAGRRGEADLEHAAWRLLAAIQEFTLNPADNTRHLMGPGYTMPPEMVGHLEDNSDRLRREREEGIHDIPASLETSDIPEVRDLLNERESVIVLKQDRATTVASRPAQEQYARDIV